MKKRLVSIVLLAVTLCYTPAFGWQKVYSANWQELKNRPYPKWFTDAKLGVFIHWGVYSVPAYSNKEDYAEWYLRGLMLGDSLRTNFMKKNYGEKFTYNDFAPLFKAKLFNPDEWAHIFHKAGAKYVVMVAKHHDGYALWPSRYARNWNSMEVGPKRDLVGELTRAVKDAGLRMGLYYSLPEWNHPLHRWDTDPHRNIGPYVEQHMIPQFKELVATYRPDLIFADGEWFNSAEEWNAAELIAWYFNLVGADAVVNDRWGNGSEGMGFITPEYSSGIKTSDRPWAEVRGLGRSFGLNRFEKLQAYLTGTELVHSFVRAVANGGGMIINVGPTADGQIPLIQQDRLIQLGDWLAINGEAIYGAETYTVSGEERQVTLQRVDAQINFNWVRNSPGSPIREDEFTAIWEGYLRPDQSGPFRIEALADDGVRVWINDQLVINQWKNAPEGANGFVMGNDAVVVSQGVLNLKANNRYPIRIEYFEKTHNARLELYWITPNGKKEVIPQKNLLVNLAGNENGLKATYQSLQQHIAYTQNRGNIYAITMQWPDDELVLSIPRPNSETRINLLGYDSIDLPWHYRKGKLIIDTSGIKFSRVEGKHAWVFRLSR
ncbi:alpha-L-fucosidase [Roseivirga thermotolerans]|uniref:alpha-L-fucosidase n=1 Tax=Roseivirga thermotolerans TaxID=1758176 RepID=UPI00273F1D59|nr:alpha-L-fucosidase [Roseivirga thermotolerans]